MPPLFIHVKDDEDLMYALDKCHGKFSLAVFRFPPPSIDATLRDELL